LELDVQGELPKEAVQQELAGYFRMCLSVPFIQQIPYRSQPFQLHQLTLHPFLQLSYHGLEYPWQVLRPSQTMWYRHSQPLVLEQNSQY
jgi:hypothetical protein